jgi:hypothetical protein
VSEQKERRMRLELRSKRSIRLKVLCNLIVLIWGAVFLSYMFYTPYSDVLQIK